MSASVRNLIRRWETLAFCAAFLVLSAALATYSIKRDIDGARTAFLVRAQDYQREVAHRFGAAEAAMRTISNFGAREVLGSSKPFEDAAGDLLASYPFISAVFSMERNDAANGDGEQMIVGDVIDAGAALPTLAGLDALTDPRLKAAAEETLGGRALAGSDKFETPDGGVGLVIAQSLTDAGLNRRGAVGFFIDGDAFFEIPDPNFSELSV